ncbi:hypothetical protein [Streptomyces mangrovisoli]|uniref:Uncharacterized protein n=1 Tax=Streptomyces mangrovisoli TaxID=1428628 RepID=A0A1J4P072_9ACTN|nr:hypothetical protein [Streptomyces mangrovisoli]OIJ67132.1 hypothetical protein WN71_014825 [Streptomyces mangrovisoli]
MSPGDGQDYADEVSGGYGGTGQTRTRLPEGDPYGGARRGGRSSSSRSLVTVVGVVVLLIAAIAFANRGGSGDADSPSGSADKPETSATAASGTKPDQVKTAGIPTGYAHTEEGAQSAAANYAVALGSTGMFKTDNRHRIVATLYTADAAAALQAPMDQAYSTAFLAKLGLDADGDAPKGSTFVSRVVPVGTTATYGATDAKVAVWYLGLIGMSGESSTDPVTSTWKTWTFKLRWTDGDWKIVSDTQKDGPAPVPGDDKAATSDEISKAIEEYGGFTYAR